MDFPKSPRISKGKGKSSESAAKSASAKVIATVEISASQKNSANANTSKWSPSTNNTEEQGVNNDLDINGNIRPSGVATVHTVECGPKFVSDSDRDTTDVDDIPKHNTGNKDM